MGVITGIRPYARYQQRHRQHFLCQKVPRLTQLQPGYCALVGTDTSGPQWVCAGEQQFGASRVCTDNFNSSWQCVPGTPPASGRLVTPMQLDPRERDEEEAGAGGKIELIPVDNKEHDYGNSPTMLSTVVALRSKAQRLTRGRKRELRNPMREHSNEYVINMWKVSKLLLSCER